MSFTVRELVLKLSPQPVPGFQMQRVCDICDTTGAVPGCPAPSLLQMPVCNLCDTTGGAPAPPCPAPSGMSPEDHAEAGPLAVLRLQLQAKLSQN